MKSLLRDFIMDFHQTRMELAIAQYGDLNYGRDVRAEERRQHNIRKRIRATSRAPMHNGKDWDK